MGSADDRVRAGRAGGDCRLLPDGSWRRCCSPTCRVPNAGLPSCARSRSADGGDGPRRARHDDERMAGRRADDGGAVRGRARAGARSRRGDRERARSSSRDCSSASPTASSSRTASTRSGSPRRSCGAGRSCAATSVRAWREAFVFGVAVLVGTAAGAGAVDVRAVEAVPQPDLSVRQHLDQVAVVGPVRGDGPRVRAAHVRGLAHLSVHADRAEGVLRHRGRLPRRSADAAVRPRAARRRGGDRPALSPVAAASRRRPATPKCGASSGCSSSCRS